MEQKRIPVTKQGLEDLKAELEDLINVKRPQITAAVAEARSHGDLRENAAYHAARDDQALIEKRIAQLEGLLRSAIVIDEDRPAGHVVQLGSTVVVDFMGEEDTYTIVGAIEAKPAQGKISNESPLGRALLGKSVGQTATYDSPGGRQSVKIVRIEGR